MLGRRSALAAVLCALLLASAAPARAGLFDTIGNAVSNVAGNVADAVTGAANTVANTAVNGWDKVSGWSEEAWSSVKGTFVNGFEFVECKVVDWSGLDLNQCWNAPPTEPCTAACKENIDKLPQACLDRIMTNVINQGNQAAIDRLEQQLTGCNRTFTVTEGAAMMALPFDTASPACVGVDWAAVNTTSCEDALMSGVAACPNECQTVLSQVPKPCVDTLVARNATDTTEQEAMLVDLCL